MKFNEMIKLIRDESYKIRREFTKFKLQITVDGITHIIPSSKVHICITPSYTTPEPMICCYLSNDFGNRKICFTGGGIYCDELKPELILDNESDAARWYVSKAGDWLEEWYAPNGERIVTLNGVAQDETFNEILERYNNTDA